MLRALHTITAYPPDLRNPVFARYPAMKYGELHAIDHYATLLAPVANSMMARTRRSSWVMVSPPVRNLPSGANLLCERLHGLVRQAWPQRTIAMEPLKLVDQSRPFRNEAEFDAYGDYARLDYETRRDLQYAEDEVVYDRPALQDRHVLFVNDINVTGSQLRWLRGVLGKAKPRAIHCLLIANTVSRVGRRFPHLESEINGSRLGDPEELASFLRKADLRYTGKLVARLLALGAEGLGYVFRSIDHARRRRIIDAMFKDGAYARDFVKEKLALAGPRSFAAP